MTEQKMMVYVCRQSTNKRYPDDMVILSSPVGENGNFWKRGQFNNQIGDLVKTSDNVLVCDISFTLNNNDKLFVVGNIQQAEISDEDEIAVTLTRKDNQDIEVLKFLNFVHGLKLEAAKEKLSNDKDVTCSVSFKSLVENYDKIKSVRFTIGDTAEREVEAPENMEFNFVGNFFIPQDFMPVIDKIAPKVFEAKEQFVIWLAGPSGYGKTSLFEAIATKFQKKLVYVNCSVMLNPEQWFGRTRADSGKTFFDPTELSQAVEEGNCVIVLDEANRVHPSISNSLFPLLDHRQETTVNGRTIKSGGGIIWGLTTNLGFQYTGTSSLDVAFRNRADIRFNVDRLPKLVETEVLKRTFANVDDETIEYVVKVCNKIRDKLEEAYKDDNFIDLDVSTRTSKRMVKLLSEGIDKATVLEYTLFNMLDDKNKVTIRDAINLIGK